jgi:hypothetical protein
VDGTNLVATTQNIDLTGIPADAFFGPQIVEIPDDGGLAFAWTGTDFFNDGAIIHVDGITPDSNDAAGVFGLGAVPGRLLHTGLTPAGVTAVAAVGLYAADVTKIPEETFLADGIQVAAWGLATGPVAVDQAGNAFAITTDFNTSTQEIRGFAAADVAPTEGATPGVPIATLDGYGDALAALGPVGGTGMLLYQPNAAAGAHLDVVAYGYSTAGGVIAPDGAPTPILTLTEADTNLTLTSDDQGRLWVGAADYFAGTVVYVLERAP